MMEGQSLTPFGSRQLTPAMLRANKDVRVDLTGRSADKWQVFRDCCEARERLNVSDRALSVLQALLSFHPADSLAGEDRLIVWPSNEQLSVRAHGMSHATLRRQLVALVAAGLICRRDSPNGKRYARRHGDDVGPAFGFDLSPLFVKAEIVAGLAAEVRAERQQLRLARERITLCRRDIGKLLALAEHEVPAEHWTVVRRRYAELCATLRTKLGKDALEALAKQLHALAEEVRNHLEALLFSDNMTGNASQNERHHQNSNTESSELEPCSAVEQGPAEPLSMTSGDRADGSQSRKRAQSWPLGLILKACPDIEEWVSDPIRSWPEFVSAAEKVRSLLGISPSAWSDAKRVMGTPTAAVAVAAILQRSEEIRSPGGYLRKLTAEAEAESFSIGPVLMALLSRQRRNREATAS